MTEPILSMSNSRVKELVKLRESSKQRKERQHFVVEGFSDIKTIFDSGRKLEELYFCRELTQKAGLEKEFGIFEKLDFDLIELGKAPFLKASYRRNADGFLAKVNSWELSMEDIKTSKPQTCIVLDEVEKPGNLGAIVRTAEAFGINTLILADSSVDYFNPNVVRSSRGLMGRINVALGTKNEICSFLKENKFSIIGASGSARNSYWDFEHKSRTAFLFGSEKDGLGSYWLDRVDDLIAIPMKGDADSLNLHVSVGCILAEYNRKETLKRL
jgi:TrmH family RNA methyltransferase